MIIREFSMGRDDLIRVRHMLEAAKDAVFFARNKIRADLDIPFFIT